MIIRPVTSPGGIEAWLVEDYAVPMFALRYAFEGGSSQDPAGMEGLANFVAIALGKGAGDLTGIEFQRRIEELAIRIDFSLSKDFLIGGIEALSETRDAAAQLLKLAFANSRSHADTVENARRRLLSFHDGEARRPSFVAEAQWDAVAFPGHPYARPIPGTAETIRAITSADLTVYRARVFARDRLKVVAAGDISADELGKFVDQVFGDLPAKADLVPVSSVSPVLGGRLRVVDMDVTQSAIAFGMGAVPYDDADYSPAYVLNRIVGGGVASKLGEELRLKRGLAFSVGSWLEHYRHAPVLRGTIATRNDMVGKSLDVLHEELQRMADGVLTQADLENAKSYLVGSYPLRFDAHSKIGWELLRHSMLGFGPEYFESRKAMIASVTLDDLRRVARRMLDPENLIVTIAGSPALQPARAD